MATTIIHDCKDCALKRTWITDTVVDDEDKKAFVMISTEMDNAEQASNPAVLDTLPPVENENQKLNREMYFKAALAAKTEAKTKLAAWWMHMKDKYGTIAVPDTAKFDANVGKFYHCVDSNGVARVDVDFVPKTEN